MNWVTITGHQNPKFGVKGTELAMALRGPNLRFALVEVRSIEPGGEWGTLYHVRDAERVSDAQVKAGVRPPTVFVGGFEEALAFIEKYRDPVD